MLADLVSRATRAKAVRGAIAHRALLTGSAWSFAVQVFSKGSVLISTFAAARLLGVSDFGRFAALQAIALLAVSLWDLGVTPMMSRRLAAGEIDLATVLYDCLRSRMALFPIWFAAMAAGCYAIGFHGRTTLPVIAIFAAASLCDAFSSVLDACVRANLDFRASAIANSISRIAFAATALTVWLLKPSHALTAMALSFLMGELTVLALLARHADFKGITAAIRSNRVSRESVGSIQRKAAPFAANGLLILVYNRLDVAIVTALATATQAGLYTPASRLQDALLIAPSTVVMALTPIAARQFGVAKESLSIWRSLRFSIVLSLFLAIPGTLVVMIFAPQIVHAFLGDQYAGSVSPIRILAASIPFIAVGSPITSALIAVDRASATTWMIGTGFVVAVGGMWILTPHHGAEGAAWASMAREPVIAAIGMWSLRNVVRGTARSGLTLHERPSRWRPGRLGTSPQFARGSVVVAVLAVAVGLAMPYAARDAKAAVAITVVLLAPIVIILAEKSPVWAVGVLVCSQVLEPFRLATPISSFSPGVVLLVIFIAFHAREIRLIMSSSTEIAFLAVVFGGFIAANFLQLLYESPSSVLRGMITLASFGMYWILGLWVGKRPEAIKAAALGAFVALLLLGFLGILVSFGLIPPPQRIAPPRSLFGITSPFKRNYGLDVAYDSTALLLPLCAPWIFGKFVDAIREVKRFLYGASFLMLFAVMQFVFQSRSMVIEMIAIVGINMFIRTRALVLRALLVSAGIPIAYQAVARLLHADNKSTVSSALRGESYVYVIRYVQSHPRTLLLGTNVNDILSQVQINTLYGNLVGNAPIHNMFLLQLLRGGLIAPLCVLMLALTPLARSIRMLKSPENMSRAALCISAIVAALVEMSINPVQANDAGLWIALGGVTALSARTVSSNKQVANEGLDRSRNDTNRMTTLVKARHAL